MRRIRWPLAAAHDLELIDSYLHEHHPGLRQPTIRKLYEAARSLRRFPHRGRVGHKEGTRELVLAPMPYLIVYDIQPELVHILRIIHSSENWPA